LTSKARIEDYGLCFTYPGLDYIELIPNGTQKEVTINNVQEYIDLVLDYTF
jgi:E3 ubiquitin-protein ligase TRIP12